MDSRGNATSMTAPMIWVICPSPGVLIGRSSNRSRPAHDLRKLLRDRSLARLVVDQLQLGDQLAGIVRGRLPRDHARRYPGAVIHHRASMALALYVGPQQAIAYVGAIRSAAISRLVQQ